MSAATPEQLERLIEAAKALERHTHALMDDLVDQDDGRAWPIYTEEIEEMRGDILRFNAIRREVEGVQLAFAADGIVIGEAVMNIELRPTDHRTDLDRRQARADSLELAVLRAWPDVKPAKIRALVGLLLADSEEEA